MHVPCFGVPRDHHKPGGMSVRCHAERRAGRGHQAHRRVVQVAGRRNSTWPGTPASASRRSANLAIEELKAKCGVKNVRTAAYTGKAASVLRKKGVEDAQTIHSLIYTAVEDEETGEVHFILSDDSPAADADLIVLDEVIMVNKEIADDLQSFGKKILVLGDPGQLPPVSGEGAFTSREPDVFLREIHRQAADQPDHRAGHAGAGGQAAAAGLSTKTACACCR